MNDPISLFRTNVFVLGGRWFVFKGDLYIHRHFFLFVFEMYLLFWKDTFVQDGGKGHTVTKSYFKVKWMHLIFMNKIVKLRLRNKDSFIIDNRNYVKLCID